MSKLIEDFATMSGLRNREVLDVSLAQFVSELIQPQYVAIYRSVGEGDQARWLTGATLTQGRDQGHVDLAAVDFDGLPLLAAMPEHERCLRTGVHIELQTSTYTSLYPLSAGQEVVGVIEVITDAPLTADHRRVLVSMSRFYRNLSGLLEENESDALTGLLNRKTFDEAFARTAHQRTAEAQLGDSRRAQDADLSGWLAVIDIDHFKRVNDNFGHLIGDEVLLLLSRLMRETFRFNDLIYRFGGEEFVVLMRSASEADAVGAFERLRTEVERFAFPQIGSITVSTGFTRVCEDDTPTDAFDRADQAVYWVKQHGRNQVKSHDQLVSKGHLGEVSAKAEIDFF
ncbi:MAG: GGDEF domain-containing protein [Aquabacterium sp.]|nr:GGDEF domain-containing protein [Aquabacterium sp.]